MKTKRKIYAKGLGGPYLHLKRNLTDESQLSFRKILENSIAIEIKKRFQNQITIEIEISEGSIKLKIVFGTIVLFQMISIYGSFRSGIDHVVNDVKKISSAVNENVIDEKNIHPDEIIYKAKRLGIPGKIQRFLKKLERIDDSNVNQEQRTDLIDDLKSELSDLLTLLENERDRRLLLEETPNVIAEEFTGNLPDAIPGQLDLRYEAAQDSPSQYFYLYEGEKQENQGPDMPSLPINDFFRQAILPPRKDDE